MISTIFTEFFNCLTVPTLVLNNNFKSIFTYKYDSNIQNSFYTSKVIDYLKNYTFTPETINIDIQNNVKYTCIMFHHYDNTPMYILIGPYTIKSSASEDIDNILSITESSLNNVVKLHSYIISKHACSNNLAMTNSPCVNHAIKYIEENFKNYISIDDVCTKLNINKCYFCSVFKKETGLTFINYLNSFKIEKSKELLKNPNLSLLDISMSVGFNNQSYYSTVFKKITLKTPLEFRDEFLKQNKG